MSSSEQNLTYAGYLQLDKLLDAQHRQSAKLGKPAHHELFFITVHQTNELWFKQTLFELNAIINKLAATEIDFQTILAGLDRIVKIQKLLNEHIPVLETLSPTDFLSFRELLTPASGFQSVQYRTLETSLGLYDGKVLADYIFYKHFSKSEQNQLQAAHEQPSLFSMLEHWLTQYTKAATKFLQHYHSDVKEQLAKRMTKHSSKLKQKQQTQTQDIQQEQLQAMSETFMSVFDENAYAQKPHRLSYQSFLSALFLYINQDNSKYQQAYQIIKAVIELDEAMATWRYRHALMVQRMIGAKVGTGGTKGYNYLKGTVESNRIFSEFTELSGYLISDLFLDY